VLAIGGPGGRPRFLFLARVGLRWPGRRRPRWFRLSRIGLGVR
jgi:hypothetical protein